MNGDTNSGTPEVSLERLRLAFPDGIVTATGVVTVGGWTCAAVPNRDCAAWTPTFLIGDGQCWGETIGVCRVDGPIDVSTAIPGKRSVVNTWNAALAAGDLLPRVDPALPGTWAILLTELAKIVGIVRAGDPAGDPPPTGYAWERTTELEDVALRGTPHWRLLCIVKIQTMPGVHVSGISWFPFDPRVDDIEDPAVALVEAFILAREKRRKEAAKQETTL